MLNISTELSKAKKILASSLVTSAFLDAELLLAHAIGKTREFVIGRPEYELSQEQQQNYLSMVERRKMQEPVAKIIGVKEFWGREFKVSCHTLDPRPDSETVVESVFELFPDKSQALRVVDFGTGSGCLLLTILAEYPNSLGLGVDIDNNTLDVARDNAFKLGLAKRSNFILNEWGEGVRDKFDLIISNPPYIKSSDIHDLAPEVSEYEPYVALDGGTDGLESYRLLLPQVRNLLSKNGKVVFEFGKGQEVEVKQIFESSGMRFIAFRNDLSGGARCILAGLEW